MKIQIKWIVNDSVAFSQDAKLSYFVCVNLYFHTDGAKQISFFISWATQVQILHINWSCIKEGSSYLISKEFGETKDLLQLHSF